MFVIFKDYSTDIGWDKAYFDENDPNDSNYSYGCPKKKATIFHSEESVKTKCEELNNDDFDENKYRYEKA